MRRCWTGFLASFAALLAASTQAGEPVRVFAASSLTEAFQEIAGAFEKANGTAVELSFAGSQVLRTQIELGAPADVFASADLVHAEALKNDGRLRAYEVFARNALVAVVPARDARVRRLEDLATPGTKIVVAGATVPVGRYTLDVLRKLGVSNRYGGRFEARVQANVVSQETNVRAVLAKVALGEADAGFVYLTDAKTAAEKVRLLEIAGADNVVAEYPAGVIATSRHPAAPAFVKYLRSDAARRVLEKYGFR